MLPVETQADMSATADATYHCPICVEKFRYKHILLAHIRKHIGIDNLCPLCMVQFDNFQHGVMHLMHECCKARDLICVECGRKGTSEEDLRNHKQTAHTGIQLECDVCDKKFPLMSQFREHSKIHGNETLELGEIRQPALKAASKSLTAGGICPICKISMKQEGK